jgi:hypothetical protein
VRCVREGLWEEAAKENGLPRPVPWLTRTYKQQMHGTIRFRRSPGTRAINKGGEKKRFLAYVR